MTIKRVSLPSDSLLSNTSFDYFDSFSTEFTDPDNETTPLRAGKALFTTTPGWVVGLMRLRDRLVSVFGLKPADKISSKKREELFDNFTGEPEEKIGLFRVYDKTETEICMGEDDKHLNFRISLLLATENDHTRRITLTTIVTFNNLLGKMYFTIVKPFHSAIVPTMLKKVVKELEAPTSGTD